MQSRQLIICAAIALAAPHAVAQSLTTGAIQGRVIDAATREPLPGVTVWVTSPSLIEPQTAITDDDGQYKITELLPGTYTITFFGDAATVKRTNIRVGANDVVPVFQELRDGAIVIEGKAPQLKLSKTDLSLKLDKEFLLKMPLPGRTIESAAGTKAGVHNDGFGLAFAGSTALENRFLVDGIDITGLTFGDVGTPILNEFVEEIEVLSGGYSAEWGRAIGGIVNVVTKTGSNQLRGSVFGTISPGFLTASRKTTPVNASSIDIVGDRAYQADFGVELGGPIVRDRLWFYAGLAPQLARTDFTRITKRQTDCRTLLPSGELSHCDPRLTSRGGFADGSADVDPATGFFITDEIDREVRAATSRGFSAIGKLNLAVTPDHQAQVSALAVPTRSRRPGLLGLPTTGGHASGLTFDTAARWTSKLDGGKTELEATVAWHHATVRTGALDPALDGEPRQILLAGNLGVWSAMGGESPATARACADGNVGSDDPYPAIVNCPMETLPYAIGGPGAIADDREDRRSLRLGVTRRGRLAGTHEIKAGLDVDDNAKTTARLFSGGAFLRNFVGPGVVEVTRWVELAPAGTTDPRFDQVCGTPDTGGTTGGVRAFSCDYLAGTPGAPGTEIAGQTIDWALYLRDSWQPRSNLTLNAGVRYEEQQLRYAEALRGRTDPLTGNQLGTTAMDLSGNWAPRLGAIWDPTEIGASKLWASYGRFFEAIPMDINDRSFGGEVNYQQIFRTSGMARPCGPVDPLLGGANGMGCLAADAPPDSERLIGSSGVLVAPGIRAQYLDEIVVGAEYQLGPDTKVGAVYQNRWLGRVIEDVSTDGAQTYIIANPGEWSSDEERRLEERIDGAEDPAVRARLARELELFRGIRRFDRPSRNYAAIELNLARRMSRGLFVAASYTFSRTEGNFPGSVSYDNGQTDPNISSQYDLIELLANRRGRLPQDRPHSLKIDTFYTATVGDQALTVGARIRAVSGIPKNALGAHYLYGPDESFLLPRGQLGRTELEHSLDLKLSYARRLSRGTTAELFVDVFNVFNQQGTFDIDRTYAPAVRLAGPGLAGGTQNNVNPISGGTYDDLIFAKAIDGNGTETSIPTARNPNFLRTATRYAPAAARLGFRVTF
jgi:outer membrane receptor protein involved in Fe transport